jgi:hypothetical protein
MIMRQEELQSIQVDKKRKIEDEEMFVTSSTMPRFMFRRETVKQSESQNNGQYNWIKRKNAYNEDDAEYTNL